MNLLNSYLEENMNAINSILVCCGNYPTKDDPVYPFVEQLVNAFAKLGIHIIVVAPQSVTKCFLQKHPLHPRYRIIQKDGAAPVEIYQPYTITLGFRFAALNRFFKKLSLKLVLNRLRKIPDVCYGHFWYYAFALFDYAKSNNIPLFVASGEASVEKESHATFEENVDFFDYYKGVFFASSKNKKESEALRFLTHQKSQVIPNAIDPVVFYKKNKDELRDEYHISRDVFIVIFVGSFIDRKGPNRVAEALRKVNDNNIKAFFIGREQDGRKLDFCYEGTLLKECVPHDNLVDYLNMADVFVLPTLAEGCCNAIIEAMACGLPIVSSNRDFNDDILDDSCSIRINPESVKEIADAIKKLYNNTELCNKMANAALHKASSMTIEKRAKKIIDFMNNCLGENCHANMA